MMRYFVLFAMCFTSAYAANPIRKVVTLLQGMQQKIEAEGEKEEKLFAKFACYCKTGGGDLAASIAAAEAKAPEVIAAIEEGEAKQSQLKEDLKSHKADRAAAKEASAEATAIREKEAAAFAKMKAEQEADIAAMGSAVTALEKGMGESLLQTPAGNNLKNVILARKDVSSMDRQDVLAFLSGGTSDGYSPASGQIVGILKQMKERTEKDLADATDEETAAIKDYEGLMAAKKKEIDSLTASIESKTQRSGELAVEIVQMKDDLGDTVKNLEEDKKFLADLEKNCDAKAKLWEEIQKTRAEELVALADTIKVLNDDDALDLFKKTLPSASASFVQIKVTEKSVRKNALAIIKKANRPELDFISLAISNKKVSFDKVLTMIDEMADVLKKEQTSDDEKKEYCNTAFDTTDDKKKALERKVSDLEAAIDDAKSSIEQLTKEIAALQAGIKALDKSVAEATEQRKAENAEFTELMASDTAAKKLLAFAKNRLNKFYNPKLYKETTPAPQSEEDRLFVASGGELAPTPAPGGIAGTGISFVQVREHSVTAPPPPPETFDGYSKKSGESNGVIGMIDLLVKDLDKEMTEAKAEEKNSQEDYEKMMVDSKEKRALDSKTLADKEGAKANTEAELGAHKEAKGATTRELMATLEVIQSLHMECDWLLQNFDARKEARAGEVDALQKAKAVLSGADFSFIQRARVVSLRGSK